MKKIDFDFAFLVHSRTVDDLKNKYHLLKLVPGIIIEFIVLFIRPFCVSDIKYRENGKIINGVLIGIPLTARQMLRYRDLAFKRVLQAARLAEKLGARIIGLGGLTSPVSNGGRALQGSLKAGLTTGNALTVCVSLFHINKLLITNDIKKVAIVGGTGSIGRGITLLLTEEHPEFEYHVFARTKEHMDELLTEARSKNAGLAITGHLRNLDMVGECELVVVATSSSEALIKSWHLKQGAIVYDVTQPQNIDVKALKTRSDLKIYDGGLVEAAGLDSHLPFGLPPGKIFSCLGETILLAIDGYDGDFCLGRVELEQVRKIADMQKKYNIKPVSL